MCLILFAYQTDPRYSLVVAANRDELFARPTQQAMFWKDDNSGREILSGKDLLAGGTWLGMSRQGHFAAVTNIRDPLQTEKKPKSRGELTKRFLAGTTTAEEYSNSLSGDFGLFAGYNLLVGDGHSLWYINNFESIVQQLEPGYYGLSNGILNSDWPKITHGKQALEKLVADPGSLSTDSLIDIMNSRERASDADLPDTGVAVELERILSSAFIENPERQYGTLCSTAIITETGGQCRFSEQNYNDRGQRGERHFYDFTLA